MQRHSLLRVCVCVSACVCVSECVCVCVCARACVVCVHIQCVSVPDDGNLARLTRASEAL